MTQKTIYFIPGTMCDERLWQPLWRQLEELSPPSLKLIHLVIPKQDSIEDIVAQLAKEIINDDSLLVGFSLGGYLASQLAITYPEKIKHLLLVSNLSSTLTADELKERSRTIDWIKANGYSGISRKRIHKLLHPNAVKNQSIISTIKAMDHDLGKSVLLQQLTITTQRKNLFPKLSEMSLPVTYCIGKQDHIVDFKKITNLTTFNKNIRVEVIENTGHMLPLEQPAILANIIKSCFI